MPSPWPVPSRSGSIPPGAPASSHGHAFETLGLGDAADLGTALEANGRTSLSARA
ncbi:MAG TPA: hypothetical protein VKG43_13225 [Acidimicrobiales bacterium]|nr:hypothetical protein [Acidimicrobiales bacterium]